MSIWCSLRSTTSITGCQPRPDLEDQSPEEKPGTRTTTAQYTGDSAAHGIGCVSQSQFLIPIAADRGLHVLQAAIATPMAHVGLPEGSNRATDPAPRRVSAHGSTGLRSVTDGSMTWRGPGSGPDHRPQLWRNDRLRPGKPPSILGPDPVTWAGLGPPARNRPRQGCGPIQEDP